MNEPITERLTMHEDAPQVSGCAGIWFNKNGTKFIDFAAVTTAAFYPKKGWGSPDWTVFVANNLRLEDDEAVDAYAAFKKYHGHPHEP